MLSNKKQTEAVLECYRRLYKAAVPSADFDQLRNNCTTYVTSDTYEPVKTDVPLSDEQCKTRGLQKDLNYYAYWCSSEKYNDIVNDLIRKYKIKGYQVNGFRMHAYLGCGPTSSVKRWLEQHPDISYEQFKQMCRDAGYPENQIPVKP